MSEKILRWVPRVLAIFAILFMMVFSFDCFEEGAKDAFKCMLMHNLPALVLIIFLILAWKWEIVGGVVFIMFSIVRSVYFNGFSGNWGVLIVMAPFLLTGILFLLHYSLYGDKR